MTAGPAFADRRRAIGLTRLAVAERIGVREVTVYRWETGRSRMGPTEKTAYTAVLDAAEREATAAGAGT